MKTYNGANVEYSTGNPLVEFFGKAGSLMEKRGSYYGNEASALDLFHNAWAVNKEKAFKLALWCRDIRGGAGNRSGSRSILNWVAKTEPAWVELNVGLIPKYGRWDDLIALFGTPAEGAALKLWASAIAEGEGLACKWAPRENKKHKAIARKLMKALDMTPKQYRKHLSKVTEVVETAMCQNRWNEVKYSAVPSVAMSRYGKAFRKHDENRFEKFLDAVANPDSKEKVNAGALFPHDLIKSLRGGDGYWSRCYNNTKNAKLVDAQFEAMPDFFETGMRVLSIADTSGSMTTKVAGDTSALDIGVSLSMYCSDRLGKDNPFYRKFVPFGTNATFFDWRTATGFTDGVQRFMNCPEYGYAGSTNIASVFDLLLNTASFMNVTPEQMPNVLLIVSDMQFDSSFGVGYGNSNQETEMQKQIKRWTNAGYDVPNIVYWNTAGYAGSPATVFTPNTGLVSGFSPSILKAVFGGEDFTPLGIMEKAIQDYAIVVPD